VALRFIRRSAAIYLLLKQKRLMVDYRSRSSDGTGIVPPTASPPARQGSVREAFWRRAAGVVPPGPENAPARPPAPYSSEASHGCVTRQATTRQMPDASRSACAHFSPTTMLVWSMKMSVKPSTRSHASSARATASSLLE
jgi:hypothetical protein